MPITTVSSVEKKYPNHLFQCARNVRWIYQFSKGNYKQQNFMKREENLTNFCLHCENDTETVIIYRFCVYACSMCAMVFVCKSFQEYSQLQLLSLLICFRWCSSPPISTASPPGLYNVYLAGIATFPCIS